MGDRVRIVIAVGTRDGAFPGQTGRIRGLPGRLSLRECSERTCTADVAATMDQVRASALLVVLDP